MQLVFNFIKIAFLYFIFTFSKSSWSFLPKNFKADFVEERVSRVSGKTKKNSGTIEYKYPGHFRFEVQKPREIVFVTNPKKAWYYVSPSIKGEKGEVTISDSTNNPLFKVIDLLGNGLKSNKHYKVVQKGKELTVNLNNKLKKETKVEKVLLKFKGKRRTFLDLDHMSIVQTSGKSKKLQLSRIDPSRRISKSRFVFKVPENTNISR